MFTTCINLFITQQPFVSMKNLFYLIVIMAFLSPFTSTAQEITRCAADEYHAEKMKNPEYAQKFRAIDRLIREKAKYRSPSCSDPIILPVAVHWNGNITNANMTCLMDIIDKQIDILNEDFGGYNTDIDNYCNHSSNCPAEFAPNALGGGTCVQFCIATQNHPASAGLSNGDYAMTFGQYNFPPQEQTEPEAPDWAGYVNFFVSDVSPPGYTNLLGLAPLGGGANPNGNGIFVTSNSFGGDNYSCTSGVAINGSSQYGLGRTATHETGHYFDLPHVFSTSEQNPTPPADCSSDNDDIADTPLQSWANYGVHTVDYNNCESDAHNTCGTQDFFFDFMDYGDDIVLYMFTSTQSDIINATATEGVNSANPYKMAATTCATLPQNYTPTFPNGCPVATPPESAFMINGTAPYEYCPAMNEISFTDMSTNFPTSWAWTFSGAGVSPTSSTDQDPTITVSMSGTLDVTLTASNNGGGADLTPEMMSYSITILPAADCGNCGESFFDTGGVNGNYSNNEDMVWTLCAVNPGDVVSIEFTSIDINTGGGFLDDELLINFGTTTPTDHFNSDFVVSNGSVYLYTGGGNFSSTSSTVVSCESCLTLRFLSDGSGTFAGWEADVSCLSSSTCDDGIQNQEEYFVDCGGDETCEICPTCPTACEGFVFTDAGGINNPTGSDQQEWTICADETDEHVLLNFTTIDMTPLNNGVLRVFEGETVPPGGSPYDYYISGSAIYVPNGSGGITNTNTTMITSEGQCFTFLFHSGSNTSNGWAATVTSDCTLPILLSDFKGEIGDNDIHLSWETASEINSDKFVLQRYDGDGIFTDITTIDACGNCITKHNYNYIDREVKSGINYIYRLKMIDRDGDYKFSQQLSFMLESSTKDWNVFPNPGKGLFTLALTVDHPYTEIKLIDKLGRLVYTKTIDSQNQVLSLDFDNIESGYYQLILIGSETTSKPIVILP